MKKFIFLGLGLVVLAPAAQGCNTGACFECRHMGPPRSPYGGVDRNTIVQSLHQKPEPLLKTKNLEARLPVVPPYIQHRKEAELPLAQKAAERHANEMGSHF